MRMSRYSLPRCRDMPYKLYKPIRILGPACTEPMPAYIKGLAVLQNGRSSGHRTEQIDFLCKIKDKTQQKIKVWRYPEESKTESQSRSRKNIRKAGKSKETSYRRISRANIHYTLHCRICRVSRQSSIVVSHHVMYCMQAVCCIVSHVVCQRVSHHGHHTPSPAIAV